MSIWPKSWNLFLLTGLHESFQGRNCVEFVTYIDQIIVMSRKQTCISADMWVLALTLFFRASSSVGVSCRSFPCRPKPGPRALATSSSWDSCVFLDFQIYGKAILASPEKGPIRRGLVTLFVQLLRFVYKSTHRKLMVAPGPGLEAQVRYTLTLS
jgi:hypothetical protein